MESAHRCARGLTGISRSNPQRSAPKGVTSRVIRSRIFVDRKRQVALVSGFAYESRRGRMTPFLAAPSRQMRSRSAEIKLAAISSDGESAKARKRGQRSAQSRRLGPLFRAAVQGRCSDPVVKLQQRVTRAVAAISKPNGLEASHQHHLPVRPREPVQVGVDRGAVLVLQADVGVVLT